MISKIVIDRLRDARFPLVLCLFAAVGTLSSCAGPTEHTVEPFRSSKAKALLLASAPRCNAFCPARTIESSRLDARPMPFSAAAWPSRRTRSLLG